MQCRSSQLVEGSAAEAATREGARQEPEARRMRTDAPHAAYVRLRHRSCRRWPQRWRARAPELLARRFLRDTQRPARSRETVASCDWHAARTARRIYATTRSITTLPL